MEFSNFQWISAIYHFGFSYKTVTFHEEYNNYSTKYLIQFCVTLQNIAFSKKCPVQRPRKKFNFTVILIHFWMELENLLEITMCPIWKIKWLMWKMHNVLGIKQICRDTKAGVKGQLGNMLKQGNDKMRSGINDKRNTGQGEVWRNKASFNSLNTCKRHKGPIRI